MIRLYGSVFLPLILLCFATPALKAQSITVLNEPLTLSAGATSIDIYIQTPPRPADKPTTSLVIKNLTASSDKFSQDGLPQSVGSTAKTMIWRTVWKPGETPPLNKTRLVLLAQWGDLSNVLTINIAREEEGQVRFSISSANLRTRYGKSVKIQAIAVYPIANPEIDASSLVDSRTGRILNESNFQIKTCPSPPPRADSSSRQVISDLCVTLNDGSIASGKYDGALVLGTSGRSNLGSVQLTVYATSVCDQWLGVLWLFLGILCFFVISVVIKGYNRWLLALLPAERLLGIVTTLKKTTESSARETNFTFPHLLSNFNAPGSLVQLEKDLSKANLRKLGYLPSILVNPFAQSDLSSEYRAFLTLRSAQIESLKLIVDWGVASVMSTWKDLPKLNLERRGESALKELDDKAIGVGGPLQMLASLIQTTLDSLQKDIEDAHRNAAFGGAPPEAVSNYSTYSAQQITVQLEQLSIAGWVLWAFLTLVVGSCALVWFNDGFGIGRDFLQCFLWGIGIPLNSARIRRAKCKFCYLRLFAPNPEIVTASLRCRDTDFARLSSLLIANPQEPRMRVSGQRAHWAGLLPQTAFLSSDAIAARLCRP